MSEIAARYIGGRRSSEQSVFRHNIINALIIVGVWALIAVFYSLITTFTMVNRGEQIHWLEAYGFELLCIWPWMVATPFIFKATYKYRFKRPHILKSSLIHLSLALTIFLVHSVNQSLAVHWFFSEPVLNGYILTDFIFFFNTRFVLYAGVVLLAYLFEFYKKDHDSRLSEARIKRQLNQAKFDSVKHRIQPLFVLGTLDSIKERMEYDPKGADKMIADFSELLRVMLDQRGVRLILLEDDFHVVNRYLQLLNSRFNLDIECNLDVDSKSTQAAIPYGLFIVSVFEYLTRYHLEKLKKIKKIYYQARANGNLLELNVLFPDLYFGKSEMQRFHRETNFDELNSGLRTLYDKEYRVTLNSDKKAGGFHIDLSVPYINYTKFEQGESRSTTDKVQVQ